MLFLYARSRWHPARLISFVRQPWAGGLKYAFQASIGGGDAGDSDKRGTDDSSPPEHQSTEGLHIDLTDKHFDYQDVLIQTLQLNDDNIKEEPKVVPIVYIPIIQ